MLRAISSFVVVKHRLHPAWLDAFVRGGAQAIEIFCAKAHFDYMDRAQIKETASWFADHPDIPFHSIHAPLFADDWGNSGQPPINIAAKEKRERINSMDEIKRALEVADTLPFRFMVQHIGLPNEAFDEAKFETAVTSIEHLRAFAKPLGVTVLVENIPNDLSTPDRLMQLLQESHFDDVGVCFDAGHSHMRNLASGSRSVAADFNLLAGRVRSTHIHDNCADRDAHLWPGTDTNNKGIDWNEFIPLVRNAPQRPALVLEIEGEEGREVKLAEDITATYKLFENIK
jgi:sugar phosphate isomerase/epimerase